MDKLINCGSSGIFCRVSGNGLPVVLVHGFAEDGSIWENQMNFLKAHYRLIIPDLPGSGKSPFDPQLKSIDDYADLLYCILDKETLEPAVVIGHSMGGYIALALAAKHPEKLAGLGLFHSTAYPDTEEKKSARRKGIAFIEQHGACEFLKQSIPNLFSEKFKKEQPQTVAELIERYNNFNPLSLVSYYNAMMDRPDRTQVLKNIQMPVLFIIGEKDSAVPLSDSLEQSHMPELCYIHILDNAAHMGMFEDSNHSNEWINDYLKPLV